METAEFKVALLNEGLWICHNFICEKAISLNLSLYANMQVQLEMD